MRGMVEGCGAGAELFVRDEGGGSIALCSCNEVRHQPEIVDRRVELRFAGGQYGPDAGSWLFHVGLWTPDDYRDEFLAWYELEHLPILLECAAWDGCRLVEERIGRGAQFYALHQLADKRALDSVERRHSRATPWFKRLAAESWFDKGFTRTLCRRIAA